MLWPKKIHTRNLITKKNSCGSKIPLPPPHNFSNGPSLIDYPPEINGDFGVINSHIKCPERKIFFVSKINLLLK